MEGEGAWQAELADVVNQAMPLDSWLVLRHDPAYWIGRCVAQHVLSDPHTWRRRMGLDPSPQPPVKGIECYERTGGEIELWDVVEWVGKPYRVVGIHHGTSYVLGGGPSVSESVVNRLKEREG